MKPDKSGNEAVDYRLWDREEKLGPPPWSPDDPKVIAWERAHGHDVRLKCYPELGCQLVEVRAQLIEEAALAVVEAQARFSEAPYGAPTLKASHDVGMAIARLEEVLRHG